MPSIAVSPIVAEDSAVIKRDNYLPIFGDAGFWPQMLCPRVLISAKIPLDLPNWVCTTDKFGVTELGCFS